MGTRTAMVMDDRSELREGGMRRRGGPNTHRANGAMWLWLGGYIGFTVLKKGDLSGRLIRRGLESGKSSLSLFIQVSVAFSRRSGY